MVYAMKKYKILIAKLIFKLELFQTHIVAFTHTAKDNFYT